MPLLFFVRHLVMAEVIIAALLLAVYAVVVMVVLPLQATNGLPLWWLEVPMALGVSLGYAWLGLLLVRTRATLARMVIRHVFRTLAAGVLLVVVPLVLVDRISPVVIGSFVLIHWFGWWWVFGRKGAPGRYALVAV